MGTTQYSADIHVTDKDVYSYGYTIPPSYDFARFGLSLRGEEYLAADGQTVLVSDVNATIRDYLPVIIITKKPAKRRWIVEETDKDISHPRVSPLYLDNYASAKVVIVQELKQ